MTAARSVSVCGTRCGASKRITTSSVEATRAIASRAREARRAAVIGGVPYKGVLPVIYVPNADFGTMQSRR